MVCFNLCGFRFAHETGAKCLYSNLPGGRSLVINHREVGENYKEALGPSGLLIDRSALVMAGIGVASAAETAGGDHPRSLVEAKTLRWSLLYLPDLAHLSRWQYDLHLRRPGALGEDSSVGVSSEESGGVMLGAQSLRDTAIAERDQWVAWYASLKMSRVADTLTPHHWTAIADMLEAHLLPDSILLHTPLSPLVVLLSSRFRRHVLVEEPTRCMTVSKVVGVTLECTSLSQLANIRFDLMVLNLEAMSLEAEQREGELERAASQLWGCESPVEYILVLDACSAAPSDLHVEFTPGDNVSGVVLTQSVHYFALEDVCSVGARDRGGVLYRRR